MAQEEEKSRRRRREKTEKKSELGGVLGLTTIIIVIIGLIFFNKGSTDIKGVKTENQAVKAPEEQISKEVQEGMQKRLEKIKEQVNNLSVADMLTSSPQVDKLITDLEAVQSFPKNQVKDACLRVCGGL